ncbi:unnamed protein product [Ceutorhynchus assimilis]|uniref:Uncharacterized protein n=1 Tax=Ceutorhynchus assimilis TaxID=467358 RepID=A0A9N9MFF8_9CUCU|nr:unnamed protein product [Ceutorhynchus assimilis]
MALSRQRQRFGRVVGFIVMFQGVAWFTLCLLGIIVRKTPPDSMMQVVTSYESYSYYLSRIIYQEFFGKSTRTYTKVIRPADFEAFLWIYVVLSAIWVVASIDQNFALRQKKISHSHLALVLGVTLLVTSVIDLVLVCLLGRDFFNCPLDLVLTTEAISTTTVATVKTPLDCQLAIGIIMTLAARGYVLWLLNAVTGICLIFFSAKALKKPALLAYGNKTIPRAKLEDTTARNKKARSPANSSDLVFYGDERDTPPIQDPRTRGSMPAALNNKNQNIYF